MHHSDLVQEGGEGISCPFPSSCNCNTCEKAEGWSTDKGDQKVDFGLSMQLQGCSSPVVPEDNLINVDTCTGSSRSKAGLDPMSSCLGKSITAEFLKVAGAEYTDPSRVGFMYYGLQKDGSYGQWPAMQWCSSGFEPRLRPWYAAAATGPKSVAVVIDMSGSMYEASRDHLARNALTNVIDTLTWQDSLHIVPFATSVKDTFTSFRMTDYEKLKVRKWMYPAYGSGCSSTDHPNWKEESAKRDDCTSTGCTFTIRTCRKDDGSIEYVQSGGGGLDAGGMTQFVAPLQEAFNFLSEEAADSHRILMFLTDGVMASPSWDEANDDSGWFSEQVGMHNVVTFTYAFGSGADVNVPRKLACDNGGMFYEIPDNDPDMGDIMSSYFTYLVASMQFNGARWVSYTELLTGSELLTACSPAYDQTQLGQEVSILLGVVCVDMTIIVDIDTLKGMDSVEFAAFEAAVAAPKYTPRWEGMSAQAIEGAVKVVRGLDGHAGSCDADEKGTPAATTSSLSGVHAHQQLTSSAVTLVVLSMAVACLFW